MPARQFEQVKECVFKKAIALRNALDESQRPASDQLVTSGLRHTEQLSSSSRGNEGESGGGSSKIGLPCSLAAMENDQLWFAFVDLGEFQLMLSELWDGIPYSEDNSQCN
jgi:hypothetical protein